MRYLLLFFLSVCINVTIKAQEMDTILYNPQMKYTQEMVDSLYKLNGLNKGALMNIESYKQMLLSDNSLEGWTRYYLRKSIHSFNARKYDSTLVYTNLASQKYYEIDSENPYDQLLLIRVFYYKGNALYRLGDYKESIKAFQKALDENERRPWKWKGYITAGIAASHLAYGNDSIALEKFKEVTKDTLYMALSQPAITTWTRIGAIEADNGLKNEAKNSFIKGVQLSKSSGYLDNLTTLYGNLGEVYVNSDIDSVSYYYQLAIDNYTEENDHNQNAKNYLNYYKGHLLLNNNQFSKAKIILEAIYEGYLEVEEIDKDDLNLLKLIESDLIFCYSNLNEDKEIIYALNRFNSLKEKFYKNRFEKNLSDLEIKYQTKQKDDSIASLEESNKQQEVILEQQSIINWILGGLLFSFTGIGILFFKQRKQKEKYKTANLEQRLLRSQLNPHFLFNALNTASSLAHQKSGQTATYIAKLGRLLRSVLENSREEFISLAEEIDTLTNYLELQSNFSKKFTYTINVPDNIDQEELLIPPMFIQPFVENAIQHGFKGEFDGQITISMRSNEDENSLLVEIENNGEAYSKTLLKPKNDEHNSLSGKILKERLAIYTKSYKTKSHYTIKDLVDGVSGTKVNLYLPLVKDI